MERGINFEFEGENCKFTYYSGVSNGAVINKELKIIPLAKNHKVVQKRQYTCDFRIIRDDGSVLFIETKGYFKSPDRSKHEQIKKQYPDVDLRIIFSSNGFWDKSRGTRYSDWADKVGIPYHICKKSDGYIVPEEWL